MTWWDVINDPIFSPAMWDIVGQDFMVDVIHAAGSVVHPDTQLIVNEFDTSRTERVKFSHPFAAVAEVDFLVRRRFRIAMTQ